MLTLGVEVADWIEAYLGAPEGQSGNVRLTREQKAFLYRFYEVDERGVRRYRRAVLSRGKGWGRSPFSGMWLAAEALGPVRFDGFDSHGLPVGRPWRGERDVLCQVLAVSASQTRNCWVSLQGMIADGEAAKEARVEEMSIRLPNRGRIEYVTASAKSREGNRPIAAVLDQTESWTRGNRGNLLAAAVRRNAGKVDGSTFETPNSYRPGEESVSEASFNYYEDIKAGVVEDEGLLMDDRRAPESFILEPGVSDTELLEALKVVYGCSAAAPHGCGHDECPGGWVNLDRIVREIRDPNTAVEDSEQFYLNRPHVPEGAFITEAMLKKVMV